MTENLEGPEGMDRATRALLAIVGVVLFLLVMVPTLHYFLTGGRIGSVVSRAKSDMRSIQTALEAYRVDHDVYPPAVPAPSFAASGLVGWGVATGLTTPVAYLVSLPFDIFAPASSAERLLLYYAQGDEYLLLSAGVDERYDIKDPRELLGNPQGLPIEWRLAEVTYDPTNGYWNGGGDVWRYGNPSLARDSSKARPVKSRDAPFSTVVDVEITTGTATGAP